MGPEQDGQLSGDPVRSLAIRLSAWAGLYVFGRGLRMGTSWGFDDGAGLTARPRKYKLTVQDRKSKWGSRLRTRTRVCAIAATITIAACAPRTEIPSRPATIPGALGETDSASVLARMLAPTLYVQRDEPFALERVVAVVHPTRQVIAYHLLWRDDAHGAWVPLGKPVDQEVVWIGYDSTRAPSEMWTFWHGTILHTDWRGKGAASIDVQWGKHGSLPRATRATDLPWWQSLDVFYLLTWAGLPDFWLGNIKRPGPWCFCHGYARYASFTEPLPLGPRINAVVRSDNPREALRAVFGNDYANKPHWPHTLRDGISD